jgi:glutaredoxin
MERAVLTISPVHSKDWRTEIVSFLQGNCPLDDEAYIKRMEARTRPYLIIEGELYKQRVCSPLLKCLSRTEGQELMKEIHVGLCGAHIGSRPLLGKVFRQDFYLPKAASDAADLVQKCESCQKCARDKKTTFVFNSNNPAHLTIAKVGSRFISPTSTNARKFKIRCGSGGVFFKMD